MHTDKKPAKGITTQTTAALQGRASNPTQGGTVTANPVPRTAKATEVRKSKAKARREAKLAKMLTEAGWTCTPPTS